MTRTDQIWTTAAFSIVGSMMAVFITQMPGCAKDGSVIPYLDDLKGASGRIDLRADQIVEDAAAVKKRTDTVGKVHTTRIEANAEHIKADVVVQQKAADASGKEYAKVTQERDAARREHAAYVAHQSSLWYVKIGRIVDRVIKLAWWLFALLIGGGFLLRIGGMFAGGWIGATMAKVGSIGLHILPIVGGVVNQFFDNAFFRQRQFALDSPKPLPPTAIVVDAADVPTTVDVAKPLTPSVDASYTSTTVRSATPRKAGKRK